MNSYIEYWTVKDNEDTVSVHCRAIIESSITVKNMPRVSEEQLKHTMKCYIDRGLEAFDKTT